MERRATLLLCLFAWRKERRIASKALPRLLVMTAAVAAALVLDSSSVNADWKVTYLHPSGSNGSQAWSLSGDQSVGTVGNHASCWNSSSQTWVDLNPAGTGIISEARGVYGGVQVGKYNNQSDRACYWRGTAASCVSLHPQAASGSCAYGIWGDVQVGEASVALTHVASMWKGTPESWINLNPAGATSSVAYGAHGDQQFGEASFSGVIEGGYWTGSASSWISLNPAGCGYSSVRDGDGTRHVGFATLGSRDRAILWLGGADEYINLTPGGDITSYAFAMCGNYQVGRAFINLSDHASIWMGSAESWFDLHDLLPSDTYTSSSAYDVDIVNGEVVVAGTAWNNVLQRSEAVMWSQPVPEPSSILALLCGIGGMGAMVWRRKPA